MTKLTVIEAARAGYAARATIYRKLRLGALNAETDEDGTVVVDPAELTRVFGEPRPPGETSPETLLDTSETERLRAENALLRAENADLRLHRDRLMTLIEHTALTSAPAPPDHVLSRLFRAGSRKETPR